MNWVATVASHWRFTTSRIFPQQAFPFLIPHFIRSNMSPTSSKWTKLLRFSPYLCCFFKYSSRLSTSNHKFLLNSMHFISFECYFDILFNPLPMWRVTWWSKNESWGWCLMMISYFNALHHISMYILTKLSDFFWGTLFGLGNLQSLPRFSGQMCFLERVHMTISTWKSLRQAGHVSQIAHLKRDPSFPLNGPSAPWSGWWLGWWVHHRSTTKNRHPTRAVNTSRWNSGGGSAPRSWSGVNFFKYIPTCNRPQEATRKKQLPGKLLPFLNPVWKIIVFF